MVALKNNNNAAETNNDTYLLTNLMRAIVLRSVLLLFNATLRRR